QVSVVAPDGVQTQVPTAWERGEERGIFWKTDAPGEYQLVAKAWGTDTDGKPLTDLPSANARFFVYQDDAEMSRQAADHEFLNKLAAAGGGKLHSPEDLKPFLKELANLPLPQGKPKARLWPDWRRQPPPTRSVEDQWTALAGSGILPCFL